MNRQLYLVDRAALIAKFTSLVERHFSDRDISFDRAAFAQEATHACEHVIDCAYFFGASVFPEAPASAEEGAEVTTAGVLIALRV